MWRKIHRPGRTREHHRSGLQVLLRSAREVCRIEWSLGDGEIAGRVGERLELGAGDLVSLHPESVDSHLMGRPFLGIVPVRAHRVRLGRNPGQSVGVGKSEQLCIGGHHELDAAKISAQSFFMLTTVQFWLLAVSSACSAPAV